MRESPTSRRSFWKSAWFWGAVVGVAGMLVVVLASGFMIETTNTDQFCGSCHMMEPFRESWQQSAHGGMNPQGFAAQCVDCHLPHGNFVEYVTKKAETGIHDLVQSFLIDAANHDWRGNSEARRLDFTFDSSCHRCHVNLLSPTMKRGGWMAHRDYLNGFTQKRCVECHPHVGHKNTWEAVADHYKDWEE